MILMTGATGRLGRPLLARLLGAGADVRCLVRDPRRLGPARVQVQIAIGNLADRRGLSRALRGVDTVVHLAATSRDQSRGSIERVNGLGTANLIAAARRANVRRFVYVSPLGASRGAPSRPLRNRAAARDAVAAAPFESLIFEASLVYAADDRWLALLRRMSRSPVVLLPGPGKACFAPIWSEDAADAITAALLTEREAAGRYDPAARTRFIELAGPQILTRDELLRQALRAFGRPRPLLHLPRGLANALVRAQELYLGPSAIITRDEVSLMNTSSLPRRGSADVEALGVQPLPIADALV